MRIFGLFEVDLSLFYCSKPHHFKPKASGYYCFGSWVLGFGCELENSPVAML